MIPTVKSPLDYWFLTYEEEIKSNNNKNRNNVNTFLKILIKHYYVLGTVLSILFNLGFIRSGSYS